MATINSYVRKLQSLMLEPFQEAVNVVPASEAKVLPTIINKSKASLVGKALMMSRPLGAAVFARDKL